MDQATRTPLHTYVEGLSKHDLLGAFISQEGEYSLLPEGSGDTGCADAFSIKVRNLVSRPDFTLGEAAQLLYHGAVSLNKQDSIYHDSANRHKCRRFLLGAVSRFLEDKVSNETHMSVDTIGEFCRGFFYAHASPPNHFYQQMMKRVRDSEGIKERPARRVLSLHAAMGLTLDRDLYDKIAFPIFVGLGECDQNKLLNTARDLAYLDANCGEQLRFSPHSPQNLFQEIGRLIQGDVSTWGKRKIQEMAEICFWFGDTDILKVLERQQIHISKKGVENVTRSLSHAKGVQVHSGPAPEKFAPHIDLTCEYNGQNPVYVRCDMPSDYYQIAGDCHQSFPTGRTIFYSGLMHRLNPDAKVLRVSPVAGMNLSSSQYAQIFQEMATAPAGIYGATPDGQIDLVRQLCVCRPGARPYTAEASFR